MLHVNRIYFYTEKMPMILSIQENNTEGYGSFFINEFCL